MTDVPVVVFDCGVFLQGLMSNSGPAVACLQLIDGVRIRLVMSEPVLLEIKDVLSRPRLRKLSANLTDDRIQQLIDLILAQAEFVVSVPKHFTYSRDPADEPYLNLAIETNAAFIVSRDRDLLDLMTDPAHEAKEFRQRFRRLKIVDPVTFLRLMEE